MLRDEDIEAAIEADIITAEQARALQALAGERRRARSFAVGREERFRLLGGFNDLFVAIGVLLLGIGLFSGFSLTPSNLQRAQGLGFEPGLYAAWATFGLLVFWGLAEFLTGRLKLVAPSIIIVVFLALMAATAALAWSSYLFGGPEMAGAGRSSNMRTALTAMVLVGPAASFLIVCLHYVRFRLPFSLFAIAVSLVILAHFGYQVLAVQAVGLSVIAAAAHIKWISLALGLAVFAWAMSFDLSDPERISRRADCGFWLHLLAAPLIVHPLAGPLINHPLFPDYSVNRPVVTGTMVALVFILIILLTLVALVIDRRALLVAGLGYLGAAIAYSLSQLSGGLVVLLTLLLLGGLIILLGVAWRNIRSTVMALLPGFPFKQNLPPYGVPT